MADSGVTQDAPPQPIGRIRVAEDSAPPAPEEATAAAASSWSPIGIGIGILLVLLMIGAMVIILWAAFQVRT